MIAQQQSLGGVREPAFEVLLCLPMLVMVPDNCLEVSGINVHPLVYLLREIDYSSHSALLSV
jgi:hypothetical protein